MALSDDIIAVYADLTVDDFGKKHIIELRDDGDGIQYIDVWNYSKPIPAGLKLGK